MSLALSSDAAPVTARDLAEGREVLVVSPHFDDAALSASAFTDLGRPIHIVTVFTRAAGEGVVSDWDLRCGFSSEAEALAARDAEDRRAFAADGHRLWRAGLVELAYKSDRSRPASEEEELRMWFDRWHSTVGDPAPLVLLPIGAGRVAPHVGETIVALAASLARRGAKGAARSLGFLRRASGPMQHPDHLWVRDALMAHVQARGAVLGFYEDHPYLRGRRGDAAADELGGRTGVCLHRVDLDVDVAAKVRRLTAYASQIEQLRRADPDVLRPCGQERYWLSAGMA